MIINNGAARGNPQPVVHELSPALARFMQAS